MISRTHPAPSTALSMSEHRWVSNRATASDISALIGAASTASTSASAWAWSKPIAKATSETIAGFTSMNRPESGFSGLACASHSKASGSPSAR